jgi:hypothetical protein
MEGTEETMEGIADTMEGPPLHAMDLFVNPNKGPQPGDGPGGAGD